MDGKSSPPPGTKSNMSYHRSFWAVWNHNLHAHPSGKPTGHAKLDQRSPCLKKKKKKNRLSVYHLDTLVSCNMTLTTHCLYMLIYKWCHMVPVEAASRSCELGQPSHHEQTVVSETVRVWTVAVSEMVTPQEGGGNAIVGDSAINHLGWKEIFWNKPEAAWEKLTLCTSGLRSSPPDVCRRYQTGRGTGRGTPVVQTQATATQRHAVMSSHQQNVTFYF